MPTKAYAQLEDYDLEKSTVQWWVQDIGAANYGTVTQDIDEFKDAIALVVEGVIRDNGFRKSFGEDFTTVVANQSAQRERKWLVHARDTTQFLDAANTIANPGYGNIFTLEIPTAKLSLLDATAKDRMNLAAGDGLTFKNSFEANVRSPWNHTATAPTQIVLFVEHVGRDI